MKTTTRHAFMLPEITDDVPTVGAVVRDAFCDTSTKADNGTWFNYNEIVSGAWTFQGSIKLQGGIATDFVNNTGAARVAGDVVMLDPNVDQSIILPTAQANSAKVGVCTEAIASGSVGRVALDGFVPVKVTGTTRLQYLQTQVGSVIAVGTTNPTAGSFGIALGTPSGGLVLTYLHPGATGDAESSYRGTTLRSANLTVLSTDLTGILYFFGNRASAQTVNFPDPTIANRPITVACEGSGTITIAVDGGTTVFGGSVNQVTGAIQNGIVVPGDSYQYKSNGIQWRAV